MKKILSLIILMLAVNLAFSATVKLSITNIELSSQELYPGASGTINFNIQNLETTDLTNVRVTASSQLSVDQPLIYIGTMKPGESKFLIFTYSAPLTLSSGSYSISLQAAYDSGGQQLTSQGGSTLNVLSSNELIINNYTTSLMIDDYTNFSITVSNHGNDIFNNIFISLVMPDGFIPESGSEFYLSSLNPGESETLYSNIFVQKEIEPKSQQFQIIAKSSSYSLDSTLNLMTIGEPEISINSINLDPKLIYAGTEQTISCQIENLGSSKAYAIKAELIIDDAFKGIKSENLGTLDREDITSAIFEILIPAAQSEITGQIKITYYDEKGKESSVTQAITYDILSADGTATYTIIIIGAAAVLAYVIYRKLKKKR